MRIIIWSLTSIMLGQNQNKWDFIAIYNIRYREEKIIASSHDKGGDTMANFKRSVRYYETDQMGIVHHSNYVRFFEEARTEWFDEVDLNYDEMEKDGIMIPVLGYTCENKKPLHFADVFEVSLKLESFNGVRFRVSYEVRSEKNGDLCATGETSHCFVDKNMMPIRVKNRNLYIYNIMQSLLEPK